MLKDKLKMFALSKGWRFVNARRDYQNLVDATNFVADEVEGYSVGETVLFLDPVIRKTEKDGIRYSGNFMVLTKSDFDDDYESRQIKYIDPLVEVVMKSMFNKLRCDFDVDGWQAIEVINVFDFNADGLSINFNLKGY